jgi:Putative bacterial sensory transduction regulator
MADVEVVDAYVMSLPALGARRLAHAEWGISVPGESLGGDALDVGLRIADGLLRAQAVALRDADDLDPWMLLWWNRQTRLVRYGCTRSRDIWVHADVPARDVDEHAVDSLLGLVAEATVAVRRHAAFVRGD